MNHIALTIGPIYKTLQNAKKPKELWSASYIFSYFIKQIIKEFKDRKFITPYIKDESIFDNNNELGLFHDRFIFESKENDMDILKDVLSDILEDTSEKLHISQDSLEDYLQINYDEFDVPNDKSPITFISPYLDAKELFLNVSQNSHIFLNSIKNKENFLLDGKNIIDDIKKLCYKKYYCIVHADGDNMSKVIEDKTNIEKVSENLFNYCKESNQKIKDYGGQTIFAGGDDLLFIAPVVSTNTKKTIFNLCDEIGVNFENKFDKISTLSFGISMNYVKFPLYEALENSRNLLFDKAKNNQKNNISFCVTKHSGQTFEATIHKGNYEVYDNFLIFTSNIKSGDGIDNFLHSLHHKIDTYKTTINLIANDKDKLINFFDNYFNKDEHKQYKDFFTQLIDFIYGVYQDDSIKKDKKLNIIYSTLRFVKFIQGDKK